MKRVDSRSFYRVVNNLGRVNQMYSDDNSAVNKVKKDNLTPLDKVTVRDLLKEIRENSVILGTNVTAIAAEDLIKKLRKNVTYQDMGEQIKIVDEIFKKEIRSATMFSISVDLSKLFENERAHFGKTFEINVPSAAYELEEACACLALGRNTSSVFHLMRIMEILLRSLNSCLGLPDPTGSDRNWGNMLSSIKARMAQKNQGNHNGWKAKDKDLFIELYASIDAVRAAWRNTTMHVEQRYNADEAHHLFVVVKQFANKIAGRMDEKGVPLA